MREIKHSVYVLIVLLMAAFNTMAQTNEERQERADKLFEKGQYVEAAKDYLHLLSLKPKDYDLNFKYGTCLLYNSNRKSEAIRYLNYAILDESVDPRAYYFHGMALHLNYQFAEAQRSYGTYLNLTGNKQDERYKADRQIQMCNNGKKLLTTFTDIIVAEKKEIDKTKFFRIYTDEQTIGGDILVTAKFQSKLDKKMGHVPIVHFPPNAKAIYYSSYGDNASTGKDIFIRRRLPNGEWGEPQLLPGNVNTPYDEDFPYMHPSGKYLYFSSTGHNSMGGYDIFLSKFDPNTNSFRTPENVDFAISSPDDDFFYVVDEEFQNAYFASARQSQDGMLHVYKVKVARVPLQEVIIMGDFVSEVDPELKDKLNIDLTYLTNGQDVGEVISNKVGKYSYVFPQGGKYNYNITVDGLPDEYKFVVELPFMDEFRPLKQRIVHTKEDGQDILTIQNLFDEEVEGADAIIAEVIRKKSELDVNINNFDLDELEQEQKNKEILALLGFEGFNQQEISSKLGELIDANENGALKAEQVKSNIDSEILAKADRIETLEKIRLELEDKIQKATDTFVKHRLLSEAQEKEQEKQTLIAAINGLKTLRADVAQTLSGGSDVTALKELKSEYDRLIEEGDETAAIALLDEKKQLIDNARMGSPDQLMSDYIAKASEIREKIKDAREKKQEYSRMTEKANMELSNLQGELIDAKRKEVEALERQIEDKKEEIKMSKIEEDRMSERVNELRKELNAVEGQIASLQNAVSTEMIANVDQNELEISVKNVEEIEKVEHEVNYEEELAIIEEQVPAVKDGPIDLVDQVKTENNREEARLLNDPSISELEKKYQIQEMNEETIAELNERLGQIDQELEERSTDELIAEKERTELYRDELIQDNQQLEEEIQTLKETTPDVALSAEDVIDELLPNYSEELGVIEENMSNDATESLRQKLELQEQLEANVQDEIDRINEQLSDDPENSESQARKEILESISESTKADIAATSQELSQLSDVASLNREDILPEFNDRMNAIQNDTQLSEVDRLIAQKELNDELLSESEQKRKELNEALKNDPNNAVLKAQNDQVNEIYNRTQNELLSLNEAIKQAEAVASVEDSYAPSDFMKDYNDRLEDLKSIEDESERLNEQLALEMELKKEVDAELEKAQRKLDRNPDDAKQTQVVENLTAFSEEVSASTDELNQRINAVAAGTDVAYTSPKEVLDAIAPELNDQINEIDNNNLISPEEKNAEKEKLLNEVLDKINRESELTNEALSSSPNDARLRENKLALSEAESRIQEQLSAIKETSVTKVNADDVLNNYSERQSEIIASNETSELQKEQELRSLDGELLESISDQLSTVNEQLRNDAGNETLLAEKAALEALRDEVQDNMSSHDTRIAELEDLADNPASQKLEDQLVDDYSAKRDDLINYGDQEGVFELNEQLVNAAEERIAKLDGSDRPEEQEELQTLISVKNQVEEEMQELIPEIVQNISPEREEELRENIDPEYSDEFNELKSDGDVEGAIDREKLLQQNLMDRKLDLQENEDQNDPRVSREIAEIDQMVISSQNREEQYRDEGFTSSNEVASIDNLREESGVAQELTSDLPSNRVAQESLRDKLRAYVNVLTEERSNLERADQNDPEVSLVLSDIDQELTIVQNRLDEVEQALASDIADVNDDNGQEEFIEILRTDYLGDPSIMSNESDDLSELRSNDIVLKAYEDILGQQITEKGTNGDGEEELSWLKEERSSVEQKRRNIAIRIGELEQRTSQKDATEFIAEQRKANDIKAIAEPDQRASLAELQDEYSKLEQYEQSLENILAELKQDQEQNPSNTTKEQINAIEQELETVRDAKRRFSVRMGELEQGYTSEEERDYREKIRKSATGDVSLLDKQPNSKEELKELISALDEYEEVLTEKIESIKVEIAEKPTREKEEELTWLEEEREAVNEKRRQFRIALGELETEVIAGNDVVANDQEMIDLRVEEEKLNERLEDESISSYERRSIEKELADNKEKQTQRENELLQESIGQRNDQFTAQVFDNSESRDPEGQERMEAIVTETQRSNAEQLEEIAKLRSDEEKNYRLNALAEKQERIEQEIAETIAEEKIKAIEEEENLRLTTEEQLETDRRRFVVNIGDLTTAIEREEEKLADAKKKERPTIVTEIETLKKRRALLVDRLQKVEQQLAGISPSESIVSEEAESKAITYTEERQVASEKVYKDYYEIATEALAIESQIANLDEQSDSIRLELNNLIRTNEHGEHDEAIVLNTRKLKEINEERDRLSVELVQRQYEANEALPTNKDEAMKMQNLVKRGVKPIQKTLVAAALLNMPNTGLAIAPEAPSVYTEANPIPVSVDYPSGLVYRVQIGAYANPIPQDLFKEFNPVSGEKITGTNITRYMAGYFNNADAVVNARGQIRELGYSDAFIIAYCNGERIGFGEARRREREGICVPQGASEMMIEVAENTAERLGIDVEKVVADVDENDYHKAPGATEARPIEAMEGLFFTVQIGVYNKPVSDEELKNMPYIFTIRLPNGHIRYNSGMFDSPEEALPNRKMALNNGINGAFVTAYYKGERISIGNARRILSKKGASILQSNIDKEKEEPELIETEPELTGPEVTEIEAKPAERIDERIEELRVQIVTKKTFDEFPRDVLNRYNAEGSFYFDESDKRVKSIIYPSADHLPRLFNFKRDIDTVYIPAGLMSDEQTSILSVQFSDSIVPGDVMDWLLRFNYRRSFETNENGLELRLFGIGEEEQSAVIRTLETFGLQPEVKEETELELELEENK